MRTTDIVRRYLDYFTKHDHLIVPLASLISPNPTTLFIVAGMVPSIPYLMDEQTPSKRRMISNQKYTRTLNIDEVGKTARHDTFFQMLDSFSFGDYFKEETIHRVWELFTTSQDEGSYGLDPKKLWMTTFADDDEIRPMWINEGVDPEHIQKMGMENNFWITGGPGPGGPYSEIYVDRGPVFGKEGGPIADENHYIEIWNLVFEGYEVDNVEPKTDLHVMGKLKNKNIDTGAGLECLAYLPQGRNDTYEADEAFPVIKAAEQLSGLKYGENEDADACFRVVAGHVRSAPMTMPDGARPPNMGRGYVLHRLLCYTVRSTHTLGVTDLVLPTLFPTSKVAMETSHLELSGIFHEMSGSAYDEEDAFRHTLETGTMILDVAVNRAKSDSAELIAAGEDAFKLYDTYGFPTEPILEMATEQGVRVDGARSHELTAEWKSHAHVDALKKRHNVDLSVYDDFKETLVNPIDFLGYTDMSVRTEVIGIMQEGKGSVPAAIGPANVEAILDHAPSHAKTDGQLADQGEILSDDDAVLETDDVQKPIKDLIVHQCRLTEGTLVVGAEVNTNIDLARRNVITRSHIATHMVRKALHEELGPQATQCGSEDTPNRLRFGFQWSKAPAKSVISAVEKRVNDKLRDSLAVTTKEMKFDDATTLSAMHLLGEKYGGIVRVVSIDEDDWSRELCGGTHVDHVGKIGMINVPSEASIGSDVRRINAVVDQGAYDFNAREHTLVPQLSDKLNARPGEFAERVNALLAKLKESNCCLTSMYKSQLAASVPALVADTRNSVAPVRVAVENVGHFGVVDALRKTVLDIRTQLGEDVPVAVALAGVNKDDKPMITVATNEAARKAGIKAGDPVRDVARVLGGDGGGKSNLAQDGDVDASEISKAPEVLRHGAQKTWFRQWCG